MLVRLLVDHPYIGSKGTVVERSDKDARGMIANKLAEAVKLCSPTTEVLNKRMQSSKVRKGTLRATESTEAASN